MEIKGRSILVLGGYGLVGIAVCRQLMYEKPDTLILGSLLEDEAHKAVDRLHMEFPHSQVKLIPIWGNVFVRTALKDRARAEVLAYPEYRRWVYDDVLAEMSEVTIATSYLAQIIRGETAQAPGVVPDAIIDCINTATALAYQDIYTSAAEVLDIYDGLSKSGAWARDRPSRPLRPTWAPSNVCWPASTCHNSSATSRFCTRR